MSYFIGRNILKDEDGYYLVLATEDIKSRSQSGNAKRTGSLSTERKAKLLMETLLASGSTWIDAHFDPTI